MKKFELLAPGGDLDSIKAAILAGANAIYCGLDKFNARNRAVNINFDDLNGVIKLAHRYNCQIFLTINIIILEREIPAIINLLNRLVNTALDAVIVQDLGLFFLLSKYFKTLVVHASTQLTTHNEGQIKFLQKFGAVRVNLSRELNIGEIKELTSFAHAMGVETEIFVHGSYCISFSGVCYFSSVLAGKSGNRGRCSQPCRDQYQTTLQSKDYPLNLKDNSAFSNLNLIIDAGVDSLKIEGRIKKFDYVYTVVNSWQKQLLNYYQQNSQSGDSSDLFKVFNRNFSNGFLLGTIGKDMFIDDPNDHSLQHLAEVSQYANEAELEQKRVELVESKAGLKMILKKQLDKLSIAKQPLTIRVSGKLDTPLTILVTTQDSSFAVSSASNLQIGTLVLDQKMLLAKLKIVNNSEYYLQKLDATDLTPGLYIPFQELAIIKREIVHVLNNYQEKVPPVTLPLLALTDQIYQKPVLSVLIASEDDLDLCSQSTASFYFQLPEFTTNRYANLVSLFLANRQLIPWFSPILIGDNYHAAVEFLDQVQPRQIVTNNTGIAYEAALRKIDWIAGPYLNIVNSYSLMGLKENLGCSGAFISNEINMSQIKSISKPADFKLCYSIYHPVLLMVSRQCLFHQVSGCKKDVIDDDCMQECQKSTLITNLNNGHFIINKTKGNYQRIYHNTNFLNTEILTDLPGMFNSFFIDLQDLKTGTKIEIDKISLIKLFERFLNGDQNAKEELLRVICPATHDQYVQGV